MKALICLFAQTKRCQSIFGTLNEAGELDSKGKQEHTGTEFTDALTKNHEQTMERRAEKNEVPVLRVATVCLL